MMTAIPRHSTAFLAFAKILAIVGGLWREQERKETSNHSVRGCIIENTCLAVSKAAGG